MQVSQPGTYEITALSDAFCTGPAYNGTATVIQNPLPNVNLGPDVTMCDGDTVTLDAGSSFAGYLWNNGNTSQTIDVGLPGNYSVIVTDYNGCTNSDGLNVSLVSPPVSLFTSSSNGLMLSLFNASLNATSYHWTFGDNTTSTETNPVHTYQAAGTYLVSLAASNGICGDSITSQSIDIVLTSTGGPTLENLLRLYPNPSTGIVTIEIDNPNKQDLKIEMNDIAGRHIYSRAMNTMKFKETIDLGTFASGFYMVKLSAGSITKISKLVLID
jgi:hypothetical protein